MGSNYGPLDKYDLLSCVVYPTCMLKHHCMVSSKYVYFLISNGGYYKNSVVVRLDRVASYLHCLYAGFC